MKIKLKNVKQHASLQLSLPDSGLVLLKGRSGVGKTNILLAIKDAFFPERKNLTTWECRKSENHVEFKDLKIVRKRGPNTLKVNSKEDDAGQSLIEDTLGMNEIEFMTSSYIKQRAQNSLLTLQPADQLKFIEKLAFGDENPDDTKQKINTKITEHSNQLKISEGSLESLTARLTDTQGKLDSALSDIPPDPGKLEFSDTMDQLKEKLDKCIADVKSNSGKVSALHNDLLSPDYALLENYDEKKKEANAKLQEIDNNIKSFHNQALEIGEPWKILTPEQVDIKKRMFEDHGKFLKMQNELKELAVNIRANLSEHLSGDGTILDQLSEVSNKMSKLAQTGNEYLAEITVKFSHLKHIEKGQTCPKCQSLLFIKDGALTLSPEDPEAIKSKWEELSTKKLEIEEDLSRMLLISDMATKFITKLENIRDNLPENKLPEVHTVAEIDKLLVEYSDYVKQEKQKEIKINQCSSAIKVLKDQKESLLESIERDKENYSNVLNRKLPLKDELRAQISELNAESDKLGQEQKEIVNKIQQLENYNSLLHEYNSKVKYAEFVTKDVDQVKEEISAAENLIKTNKNQLEGSIRLKELSNVAAVEAIDEILNSINLNAQYYITQMFPDTGTSAAILNHKKIGTGETRAKLSLRLFHKGYECKSLKDDLSGGEQSRLTLAFQLALSDLYNSPILMIDEGFAGLDISSSDEEEATMDICLRMLKEVSERKLIIVAEHGALESYFDHIEQIVT
jgi:DNA repair exonuclease SbcCD ATPase subunit